MSEGLAATTSSGAVGMIANPASGKDIRRLVGHATTIDNQSKIGILRRALIGAGAVGVERVLIMPDSYDLGQRAIKGLDGAASPLPEMRFVPMPVLNETRDSTRAAEQMAAQGVGCILVLGGDGTLRAASKGAGKVPLLGISTGTNNVLPAFVEGTIAGMAAGLVAQERVARLDVTRRHKWIQVESEGAPPDRALVDVAALSGRFVGSRAVWRPEEIHWLMVTRADPASIGISAIAAALRPVTPDEPMALFVSLALPDGEPAIRQVLAAVGPGMLQRMGIAEVRVLAMSEAIEIRTREPILLALDGEREIALQSGQTARLTPRADGPWIVDVQRVMQAAVAGRLLDR